MLEHVFLDSVFWRNTLAKLLLKAQPLSGDWSVVTCYMSIIRPSTHCGIPLKMWAFSSSSPVDSFSKDKALLQHPLREQLLGLGTWTCRLLATLTPSLHLNFRPAPKFFLYSSWPTQPFMLKYRLYQEIFSRKFKPRAELYPLRIQISKP